MRILLFIQARHSSTRLPGKILQKICDKTLIELVVERFLYEKKLFKKVAILTTEDTFPKLKPIFENTKIHLFRGDENNVLSRFYYATLKYCGDIIVRATADNPLVDIPHLRKALEYHIENDCDLTHYIGCPLGTGVEILSKNAIISAYRNAKEFYQKEHVTPYVYENEDKFKVAEIKAEGYLKRDDIRLTIDEKEDFELIEKIFHHFYEDGNNFSLEEVFSYLDQNEELKKLNTHVIQKKVK